MKYRKCVSVFAIIIVDIVLSCVCALLCWAFTDEGKLASHAIYAPMRFDRFVLLVVLTGAPGALLIFHTSLLVIGPRNDHDRVLRFGL